MRGRPRPCARLLLCLLWMACGEGADPAPDGGSAGRGFPNADWRAGGPRGEPDTGERAGPEGLSPAELSTDPGEVPDPYTNPICKLAVSPEHMEALLADVAADVEVEARFEAHGRVYDVGLELHGASSRHFAKKSFKLDFGEAPFTGAVFGDPLDPPGYGRLVLKAMWKDQSLIREAVSFDAWRHMGYAAPRHGYCNLFLDGEYWGLYVVVERVDEELLERAGFAPGGALYKAVKQKADFDPKYNDELGAAFEKKALEDEPWDDLLALVVLMQTTQLTKEAFYAAIDPVFPIAEYYDRMIWVSVTQNIDHTQQNFYLYGEPLAGGVQWALVPWDGDVCLGQNWKLTEPTFDVDWKHNLDGGNYFSQRLVQIEELRHEYVERFEEALDGVLHRDTLRAFALARMAQVESDLFLELERWQRPVPSTPGAELEEILAVIEERPDFLRDQLELFSEDPDTKDEPWQGG